MTIWEKLSNIIKANFNFECYYRKLFLGKQIYCSSSDEEYYYKRCIDVFFRNS